MPHRQDLSTLDSLSALQARHAELDQQIHELDRRKYLSVNEQMERKRLQKLKLFAKDRIAMLNAND